MRRCAMCLALLCLGFTASIGAAAETAFFDLTAFTVPFTGAHNAVPEAINNLGQVVGSYSDAAGHAHGFVRDAQGRFSPINVIISGTTIEDTVVRGINDFGVIVGSYMATADPANRRIHGFVLARGVATPLDAPFEGAINTRPRGINDYGTIVGSYDTSAGRQAFVRYERTGRFHRIALPFAGADAFAFACTINNLGQVLGGYRDAAGFLHGFLVTEGVAARLNAPGAIEILPTGINDLGQIVGVYVDDRHIVHSFFKSDGRFVTLGLPGAPATILSRAHLTSAPFPALVPGVFGLSNTQITGIFRDTSDAFHSFLGVLGIPAEKDRIRESAHVGRTGSLP